MQRTRVKICGLTRAEDAAAAVAAGADACGVVFAASPRQVDIPTAAEVLAGVPDTVMRIGVFVDADPAFVEKAVIECELDVVQLHGNESAEFCARMPRPVIKALGIGTDFDARVMEPYRNHVFAYLLDKVSGCKVGGTGETFDWLLATDVARRAPTFLAGGLTPENVAEAMSIVRPYAVDVSSGVEVAPGIKDPRLIESFVAAVREADLALGCSTDTCPTHDAEVAE